METAEYSRSVTLEIGKYADTTSGIVTTSDMDLEVVEVNIADKMDANRPTTRGIVTIPDGEPEVAKVNIVDKMDAVRPTTSCKKSAV